VRTSSKRHETFSTSNGKSTGLFLIVSFQLMWVLLMYSAT